MSVKRVGKYEIGKTLGEGTFGKVKYAANTETGEGVAIKVLDKERIQKQNMGAQIKKEISIMKMVRHPHVVQLREVLASRTKIFIVLELVTGGELFDKIVNEGRFPEEKARFYFRQLIEGVEYCHSQGVCHRDLKPENLLLDENGDLKISDFGLSALYSGPEDTRQQLLHTTCGTPNYVAPEVLADKGYDGRTADVWSCGVILYVLLAGFLPFDEPTMTALFRKIQSADFSYPSFFDPGVCQLLDRILVADPERRVTVFAIKEDPWFIGEGASVFVPTPIAPPVADLAIDPSPDDVEAAVEEGAEEARVPAVVPPIAAQELSRGNSHVPSIQSERQVNRVFQFSSRLPPAEIIQGIQAALVEMECESRVFEATNKIKATCNTSKGMIGVIFQVFPDPNATPATAHQIVEVRRGKGDILQFHQFYSDLVRNKINHLIEEQLVTTINPLTSPRVDADG